MAMYDDIQKKYIEARKSQDKFTTNVLNMLISDLKYEKINKQIELDDAVVLSFIQKSIKQKKEALEEFKKANRPELIEKESAEIDYLTKMLPAMMSDEDIKAVAMKAKQDLGISSPSEMGKLMKEVMAQVKGKADGSAVSRIVGEVIKG